MSRSTATNIIGNIPGLVDFDDDEGDKRDKREDAKVVVKVEEEAKEEKTVKGLDDAKTIEGAAPPRTKRPNPHIEPPTTLHTTPHTTPHTTLHTTPHANPQKMLRAAGGEIWQDPTLGDWDPTHFRIFVGDLSRQVTDGTLLQAFASLFPSTSKARVVRDKHTGRSKGFGFVAMSDEADFRRAMREMHGKYIGDRPVKLKKSNWSDRSVEDAGQVAALQQLGYRVNKRLS